MLNRAIERIRKLNGEGTVPDDTFFYEYERLFAYEGRLTGVDRKVALKAIVDRIVPPSAPAEEKHRRVVAFVQRQGHHGPVQPVYPDMNAVLEPLMVARVRGGPALQPPGAPVVREDPVVCGAVGPSGAGGPPAQLPRAGRAGRGQAQGAVARVVGSTSTARGSGPVRSGTCPSASSPATSGTGSTAGGTARWCWNYPVFFGPEAVRAWSSTAEGWRPHMYEHLSTVPPGDVADLRTDKTSVELDVPAQGAIHVSVMPWDRYGALAGRILYPPSIELMIGAEP